MITLNLTEREAYIWAKSVLAGIKGNHALFDIKDHGAKPAFDKAVDLLLEVQKSFHYEIAEQEEVKHGVYSDGKFTPVGNRE